MVNRAYMLLDIKEGKVEEAIKLLRESTGVVTVDVLEGPPDIMTVLEASGPKRLSQLTVRAFASVEPLTEQVCLLPTRKKFAVMTYAGLPRRRGRRPDGRKTARP
jgi:hypothetical protein